MKKSKILQNRDLLALNFYWNKKNEKLLCAQGYSKLCESKLKNIYFHYRYLGRENKTLFILPLRKEGTYIILLAKGTN